MWRLVIASESHGQERMEDEGHIPSGRSTPVVDNMAGQNNVDASPIVISTTKVRHMNILQKMNAIIYYSCLKLLQVASPFSFSFTASSRYIVFVSCL